MQVYDDRLTVVLLGIFHDPYSYGVRDGMLQCPCAYNKQNSSCTVIQKHMKRGWKIKSGTWYDVRVRMSGVTAVYTRWFDTTFSSSSLVYQTPLDLYPSMQLRFLPLLEGRNQRLKWKFQTPHRFFFSVKRLEKETRAGQDAENAAQYIIYK